MPTSLQVSHPALALEDIRFRERSEKRAHIRQRLMAVRMTVQGSFAVNQIAQACGFHPNRVAVWVARFNERGFEGLENLPRRAKKPLISKELEKEVTDWVRRGADPKADGFQAWTAPRIVAALKERHRIKVSDDTIYLLLWRNGFRHRKARKVPAKADCEALAAFEKKTRGRENGGRRRR